MSKNQKIKIVRTPLHNIPVGEPIKHNDGHYSLRLKKPGEQVFEDVAIDQLFSMVISEAEE